MIGKKKLTRGFTLIELLIVAIILVALSTIAIQVFNRYKESQALDLGTQTVVEAFREARSQTLDSLEDSSYGVHLASSTVTLFKGAVFSPSDPENEVRELASLIVVASTTLSGDVVFERLTGAASNHGSVFMAVEGKNEPSKEIIIESTGLVYVEE